MHPAEEQYDVGVLVGRFQVHELHDAHRDLIQYVCDRHEKVVIFLGLSPLMNSTNNPLDFEARKQMILDEFPDATVLYIKDTTTNEAWSKRLDSMVNEVRTPGQTVILYGGRDSFIARYTGLFETQELMQDTFRSGTEVRRAIARSRTKASADFRAGVIWASQARFPTAYQAVDIAILRYEGGALTGRAPTGIMLGRKHSDGDLYRLIGGFSDPRSESLELDAKREVREETGLEVGDLNYIGSRRVDDWRYRDEPDCIKTALFTAKYLHGRPTPGDDIDEVRWFPLDAANLDNHIVPTHRPLMEMLRKELDR